eukprot:5332657-Amphidinium_carterae.1
MFGQEKVIKDKRDKKSGGVSGQLTRGQAKGKDLAGGYFALGSAVNLSILRAQRQENYSYSALRLPSSK